MDSSHLLMQMKHFVRSSEHPSTSTVVNDKPKEVPRAAFVSGHHVKQFYEKTVGKEALETTYKTEDAKDKVVEKSKTKSKSLKVLFNVNSLLKAVETGNVEDVRKILEANEEAVNCQDQFGWTPLMSACCAGNKAMVELLLGWKPDLIVTDRRGNTCRDLSAARGHQYIVDILNQHVRETRKQNETYRVREQMPAPNDCSVFYCKVCKQNVENTTLRKHLSSTVHNFHAASKRKMPTFYGIPESNKGFQILVRSGWNKEDGLGPSGEGHKFPPKTILKQDRTGLGAKKYKARVTHTLENTRKEAKPKDTFKRDLKHEKRKEQRMERNLRLMLS